MDNASKALIMAGAILVSLGIVGLGVYVFSISKDMSGDVTNTMQSVDITTKNAKLGAYQGTSIRGTQVKEFLEQVRICNTQGIFPIDVAAGDGSSTTDIVNNAYYTIVLSDEKPATAKDGYYDTYTITPNAGT